MFYRMIQKKRDAWYASDACTINDTIDYIIRNGHMRDAQIDAIKTYLFLKIACENRPLSELFASGAFNNIDLEELELSGSTRTFLENNSAATALFEYASQVNDEGEQVSEKIVELIKTDSASINYEEVFKRLFYNVEYTDYLFSLPMGAGKTFLMAAFIYLDLYFADNEPSNKAFSHNFMIFAPSGTKTSIVPSLKTIQKFDPTWVIPDPAATDIKRKMSFEILDQVKSGKKSNKTKNPNVQKIANHQPYDSLFGLVAVTNAEKVILDRMEEKNGQITWNEGSDDEKDRQANELRNLIGKLPQLAVFIDEVHHAASQGEKKEERKLRSVVNRWANNGGVTNVLGFSGTPYFSTAEKIEINDSLKISNKEISNVVYYYPLIEGIGNFLKKPTVKIAEMTSSEAIVEQGVREFLDTYKDTTYEGGLAAKLGIYCGTIEKCEEVIYPLVVRIANEYGIGSDSVLKFHGGNKQYPQPADSALQFASLDQPFSNIRIVLLVQIGKEGWDCQSLTGIILSQEGDCPTNMVLQTSCRCLRQVGHSKPGSALIYLNKDNAEELKKQLSEQHHISIKEFEDGERKGKTLKRYDRTEILKLPKIDFYQLKVSYEDLVVEEANPKETLKDAAENGRKHAQYIVETDFNMKSVEEHRVQVENKREIYTADFHRWLYSISREGFGKPTYKELCSYDELESVFKEITIEDSEKIYFNPQYDIGVVNSEIRKAFADKRDFKTVEELIPENSSLLNINNFSDEIFVSNEDDYYPTQYMVNQIMNSDQNDPEEKKKTEETIKALRSLGQDDMADELEAARDKRSRMHEDRSYHYLPYRTDSSFEQKFLEQVLTFDVLDNLGLEVYYNGDRAMTEFKIKCYKKAAHGWDYIGMYTPDFIILKRKSGKINKVVIVETKGKIYANDPTFKDKRSFMENHFSKQNNETFGYERFDYLYLEDAMSEQERIDTTYNKITEFFKEAE